MRPNHLAQVDPQRQATLAQTEVRSTFSQSGPRRPAAAGPLSRTLGLGDFGSQTASITGACLPPIPPALVNTKTQHRSFDDHTDIDPMSLGTGGKPPVTPPTANTRVSAPSRWTSTRPCRVQHRRSFPTSILPEDTRGLTSASRRQAGHQW